MNTLTFALFAGLILFVLLLLRQERQKYQRYRRLLRMDVGVQFYESTDAYDHLRRGSVVLNLLYCSEDIKAIVIRRIQFSHPAFHIPAMDKLYFKGEGADLAQQTLSVSFRIRRHNLRRQEGKRVYIFLSGWTTDHEGNAKPFKARVPYLVGTRSASESTDHAPTTALTPLT